MVFGMVMEDLFLSSERNNCGTCDSVTVNLCFYASLMLGRNSFSHNVLMEAIVRLSES
jgi:hypothetical protein